MVDGWRKILAFCLLLAAAVVRPELLTGESGATLVKVAALFFGANAIEKLRK